MTLYDSDCISEVGHLIGKWIQHSQMRWNWKILPETILFELGQVAWYVVTTMFSEWNNLLYFFSITDYFSYRICKQKSCSSGLSSSFNAVFACGKDLIGSNWCTVLK